MPATLQHHRLYYPGVSDCTNLLLPKFFNQTFN